MNRTLHFYFILCSWLIHLFLQPILKKILYEKKPLQAQLRSGDINFKKVSYFNHVNSFMVSWQGERNRHLCVSSSYLQIIIYDLLNLNNQDLEREKPMLEKVLASSSGDNYQWKKKGLLKWKGDSLWKIYKCKLLCPRHK